MLGLRQCQIDACTNVVLARGWCGRHYARWKRTGSPIRTTRRETFTGSIAARLEAYSKRQASGCVEWTGRVNEYGYGVVDLGRPVGAHRISFEQANGPIAAGLHVLHRCDNRKCINADHLFLGTDSDNKADMMSKDRIAWGERAGGVRLTADQVLKIRASAKLQADIAKEFGISPATVSDIRRRRTWARLPEPAKVT